MLSVKALERIRETAERHLDMAVAAVAKAEQEHLAAWRAWMAANQDVMKASAKEKKRG